MPEAGAEFRDSFLPGTFTNKRLGQSLSQEGPCFSWTRPLRHPLSAGEIDPGTSLQRTASSQPRGAVDCWGCGDTGGSALWVTLHVLGQRALTKRSGRHSHPQVTTRGAARRKTGGSWDPGADREPDISGAISFNSQQPQS